ncbi:phosphotransferase family protein [Pseudonocardia humida]|uniref:Aminoglycoside phosphotransferase family protein n=1 Tax=Pseudonocardia humida TaxID=2800819 RepID=A0ABT1ACI0_9PSEU|nr:aminoglycoside phosphotransferase family protein [Pseudonocardia humida]MCO1660713.1 aminoglycoside phosphotransferase family protein [Pseudonocardia humida]
MTDVGPSPTQRVLEPADVAELVCASFGSRRCMIDAGPMSGGGFAAVWWVRLDDGRTVVLKVSPPAAVGLLGYERGLLAAEARYYRLVAERAARVPVPRVLHVGRDPDVLDGEWMFMTFLPGRSLAASAAAGEAVDDSPVRRDLGAALAALHTVPADEYGYDGGRIAGPSWRGVFAAIVDELLVDADVWGIELPAAPARIRGLVDRHGDVLDLVTRPALVHFDGWDGNVLAAPDADGGLRLTGLVDGERYLRGDPLMDFVSPALYSRIEDEPRHPFLEGYARGAGGPVALDAPARRRLALYRLHLYLLMAVEMPSRGMTGEAWRERRDRIGELLDQQLSEVSRRASAS